MRNGDSLTSFLNEGQPTYLPYGDVEIIDENTDGVSQEPVEIIAVKEASSEVIKEINGEGEVITLPTETQPTNNKAGILIAVAIGLFVFRKKFLVNHVSNHWQILRNKFKGHKQKYQ